MVPVTGRERTMEHPAETRVATVHRTVAFTWVRVRPPPLNTKKENPRSGFSFFGAGDRTRTGTLSPAVDFESTTSTIPSHRQGST